MMGKGIYMGFLDDRVGKYPWSKEYTYKDYVGQLMQQIIIGRKPMINDGYLLQNPILKEKVFGENDNFFLDLLRSGEVIIPARCNNFDELINVQHAAGVPGFGPARDQLSDRLGLVHKQLIESNAWIKGPDSGLVWKGFNSLIKDFSTARKTQFLEAGRSKAITEKDLDTVLQGFFKCDTDDRPASRTNWESVLNQIEPLLSQKGATKKELMGLANEAYHYNYAQLLANEFNVRVAVQTALSPAFSYLIERKNFDLDSEEKSIPLICIPAINSLCKKKSLDILLGDTDVGRARREFIVQLDNYFSLGMNGSTLRGIRESALAYNALIKENFSVVDSAADMIEAADLIITISTIAVDGGVSSAIMHWAMVGVALHAVTHIADRFQVEIDYSHYPTVAASIGS